MLHVGEILQEAKHSDAMSEREHSSGSSTSFQDKDNTASEGLTDEILAASADATGGGISELAEEPRDWIDGGNVEKQVTNKSHTHSVNNVASIPNGGLRAWLQVLGAFFLFFNSWGIINTFGVYQTYYESSILASSSPSDISWIGSVQAFFLLLVGPATGPIYDAGYFRGLLLFGTIMIVFGQMMLSLASVYYQVFLAQAVCVGIGAGCLFIPSVAILSTYFNTRLATATGLAAAGSSLGGVIYPIVLYNLIPQIGFAWATRTLGFMMLGTLVISNSVMRVRVRPAHKRKLFDFPFFLYTPYTLFVLGGFCAFMGLYAPFFYVESYAISYNITSQELAFYTLPIINSASILGRIIPNFLADRTGPFNIIVPACVVSGIIALCLIPARNEPGLIILCLLYGFFSGALVSLPPTIFVHLSFKERGMIGTRMGMGFFVISIGLLLGTPICGWILNASSFTYVWVFSGVLIVVGGALIACARISRTGLTLMTKA